MYSSPPKMYAPIPTRPPYLKRNCTGDTRLPSCLRCQEHNIKCSRPLNVRFRHSSSNSVTNDKTILSFAKGQRWLRPPKIRTLEREPLTHCGMFAFLTYVSNSVAKCQCGITTRHRSLFRRTRMIHLRTPREQIEITAMLLRVSQGITLNWTPFRIRMLQMIQIKRTKMLLEI